MKFQTTHYHLDLLKDTSLYEGAWFVGDAMQKNPELLKRIQTEKKVAPTRGTPFIYDIVQLLIWAYENTPVKTGESVPTNEDVIKTIQDKIGDYPSVFGNISVSPEGIVHTDALVKKIEGGKVILDE